MNAIQPENKVVRFIHVACLLGLLIFVAWSTGGRLIVGWSADDGAHLRFSSLYRIGDFLFSPELLWIASFAHLTPLLNLFYSFNLEQFGLNTIAWRLSMVVLSVMTVAAFYAAIKQYMRSSLALFVAMAWALSVPFFYTAATFMTSHYMIGMLAASICVWCYARWVRNGSWHHLVGAAFFYAMAAFSKEVFLPLPGLLLLQRPWRRSILGMAPLAMVLSIYLTSRYFVLGTFIGGYRQGQYVESKDLLSLAYNTAHLAVTLYGGYWQLTVVALVILIAFWRATNQLRIFAIASAVLVVLPLLPLMGASHLPEPDRYFFVLSAVSLFVVGLLLENSCQRRPGQSWFAGVSILVVTAVLLQQYTFRVPMLVQGFGMQAAIFRHALEYEESMLILNPGLPADDSYWSHALNNIREAKARQQGRESYEKILMVSDPQAPVVFGLHALKIPIYRYDGANCRCLVPYTPVGTPNLSPVSLVPQQTMQLHLTDAARRLENHQSSWGNSVQTTRRILPQESSTLEITGQIHLDTELDWLFLVLPFHEKAVIEPTEPVATIATAQGVQHRPFRLRMRFSTPELAAQAHDRLCIAVPSILRSPYALLQGQPDYCNVFVQAKLLKPK